jgi:hypothetical protein
LPPLVAARDVTFVVANGENLAGGDGLTPETVKELFDAGVHCITSGDHVFKRKEILPLLQTDPRILRPANFPAAAAGKGWTLLAGSRGERVGVVNLLGRVFMKPIDDPFAAVGAALNRLAGLIDKLLVYPTSMQKNLDKLGGLIHSQRVLIALTQKGVAREDAYALVQRNAMKVWGGESDFLSLLKADKDVRAKLSDKELEANFNLDHHFKHVDTIFKRVFGSA